MNERLLLPALVLLSMALAGACAPAPQAPSPSPTAGATNTPAAAASPTVAATETSPAPTVSPLATYGPAAPAVEAAMQQASQATGASPESILVSQVQPMDWPDTSLGCPQPGNVYAQVITPGWLIVIDAGGQTLEFHADQNGETVVLCEG